MSEFSPEQKQSPSLPNAGGARREHRGAGSSVKNQLRTMSGYDAQATLLTPLQAKADPFARRGESGRPKPVGGPTCRVGGAPALLGARADKTTDSVPKPAAKPEANDIAEPKVCDQEGLEAPNVESVDDRPDDAALFIIANDAATETVAAIRSSVDQRVSGFHSAVQYLADSAKVVNEDKGTLLAFVEQAFSVVTSALMGVGLAGMAAKGAVGVLKGVIGGALDLGVDAVAGEIGEAAKGDKVNFAEFAKSTFDLCARLALQVESRWKVADVRTLILNAPYPHREAPAAVAAAEAIRDRAFRMQFTSSVTSWANKVHEVKGDEAGVLVIDVEFDPSGSFTVAKSEVPVMGTSFSELLTDCVNDGSENCTPLTLAETLVAPTGGIKVIVRDQSQATYTWDPAQRAITTPDAELMHHRVGAWSIAHVGRGVVPVVGAHRFLFEALGARTFAALGVGR